MYELVQVSERCYYIDCPSKIGIIKTAESEVCLIDSGNHKETGKKIKRILDKQGWSLRAIYNTHAHGDHIGGNHYLQQQTGCKIYVPAVEHYFAETPILSPSFLYGGLSQMQFIALEGRTSVASFPLCQHFAGVQLCLRR